MLGFGQYINEALEQFKKLQHLEHAEDLHIKAGEAGYHHALGALKAVHERLQGKFNPTKITTKYDGSPSIVFGHNPENGKFFVASKSAFNATPKINYTEADIEKNHGHAPGLVDKLKQALKHLPKIAPKRGVYQGDFMYGKDDVHESKDHFNFTPNTLMYSAEKKSEEGKKIAKSKMGIVIHTKYHGRTLAGMKAGFDVNHHEFKEHHDVHVIPHEYDPSNTVHSGKNITNVEHHLKMAEREHRAMHPDTFHNVEHLKDHLSTYINHTVRENTKPTIQGFKLHLLEKGKKEMESVSTAKAKQRKYDEMHHTLTHLEHHAEQFDSALKIHHHLQQAKDALVDTLNHGTPYEHSIAGKESAPEGFVAVHNGHPVKLVNRAEFSRANFSAHRK